MNNINSIFIRSFRNIQIFLIFLLTTSVIAQPTITSFTPKYGEAGDAITLTGTNFNTTASNNVVRLGGMKCSVTNATSTSLTIILPEQIRSDYFWVTNKGTKLSCQSYTRFKAGFSNSSYTFSTATFQSPITFNVGSFSLANQLGKNRIGLADLDEDDDLDFIIWDKTNDNLSWWENVHSGNSISSSSLSKTVLISSFNKYENTILFDIDGDGDLDIFGARNGSSTNKSVIVRNTSSTSFSVNTTPITSSSTYTDRTPQMSDINLDGKIDYTSGYSWSAYFRENLSTTTAVSFATKSNSPPSGDHDLILPIDINLDKKMDYVPCGYNVDPAYTINTTTKGNNANNFSFSSYTTLTTNNGASTKPRGGLAVDLNNDDKEDLVVYSGSNTGIHIFRNTSINSTNYGFATRYTLSTSSGVYDITTADMDNDGKLDLIYSDGIVLKYLRNTTSTVGGTISFASPVTLVSSLGSSGPQIEVFDFDQDGDFDILAMISSTNLKIYENNLITTATIATSGTLTSFSGCANAASQSQSFSVTASGLSANLSISAPTGYEVSESVSTGYNSSLSIAPSSGAISKTIYVRLASSSTTGSKSGNITLSSTGASTVNISVSGSVNSTPTISGSTTGFISETSQLSGSGTPATSNAWSSSSSSIANISTSGLLTFNSSGNTQITYTDNTGCSVSSNVNVKSNIMYVVNENNSLHNLSNWSNNSSGSGDNPTSFGSTFKFYVFNSNIFANTFSISEDLEIGGELYIPSFVTLNISNGKKLEVSGTFNSVGTITGTGQNDSLVISASSNQTIEGTINIGNFIVNLNSNSVSHSANLNVYNEFSVLNVSNYTKSGSGQINLKGTSTNTARLGEMSSNFDMEINCEFYIPSGKRKFRFLGHPFNTAIGLSELTDDIDITGTGGSSNGFTNTSTNNPSAYWFDTDNGSGAQMDDGWTAFSSTTAGSSGSSNAWDVGEGIIVMIRGSKGEGLNGQNYTPSAVTIDFTGTPKIGNTTINLKTTGTGAASGFNLIANPYASPVDISNVIHGSGSANRLNKTIYTRDPQSGSYKSKLTQSGNNFVIPAYTAFWIKATTGGSTPSIQFTESDKQSSSTLVVRTESDIPDNYLEFEAESNGESLDFLHFHFAEDHRAQFEELHDAFKLKNDGFNMFSKTSDGVPLCRDFRNLNSEIEIPLIFENRSEAINFNLKLNHQTIINNQNGIYLIDRLNNSKTKLTKDNSTPIEIDPKVNGSSDTNRFVLVITDEISAISPITNLKPIVSPNPFCDFIHLSNVRNSKIQLYNLEGKVIYQLPINNDFSIDINTIEIPQGVYILKVTNSRVNHEYKLIK